MPNQFRDPLGRTPILVEFIASTWDCFLQEFNDAVTSQDSTKLMVALAKLEELSRITKKVFKDCGKNIRNGDLDEMNYASVMEVVRQYVGGKLHDIIFNSDEDEEPDTIRTFQ